ncbi:MAG: flagellar FlbD family protein [Clostridiales bacterium]|jgi:flagellar protein FlbD|nr:flagellar FlbD family protein [Clostridiales bacterium]
MITITKLNDKQIVINCELIEMVESNPDTMITMNTGRKIIVRDSVDEIIDKTIAYKKEIFPFSGGKVNIG